MCVVLYIFILTGWVNNILLWSFFTSFIVFNFYLFHVIFNPNHRGTEDPHHAINIKLMNTRIKYEYFTCCSLNTVSQTSPGSWRWISRCMCVMEAESSLCYHRLELQDLLLSEWRLSWSFQRKEICSMLCFFISR